MEKNTYNGWTNYETWNVALWIGDMNIEDDIKEHLKRSKNPGRDLEAYLTDPDGINMFPANDGASCQTDLLSAAISEVNWDEIAEHYTEEEEEEDTNDTSDEQ